MTKLTPLTLSIGIYASFTWKIAHEKWRLQKCNTIIRAGASPGATLHESGALGALTSKLPSDCLVVLKLIAVFVRYPVGSLTISPSLFDMNYVKLSTEPAIQRRRARQF